MEFLTVSLKELHDALYDLDQLAKGAYIGNAIVMKTREERINYILQRLVKNNPENEKEIS